MIRRWQNDLLADPAGYSPTYLKTVNNQMSAVMNYAVRFYGLPSNPVVVCGPFGKKTADEMQFWTRDEFRRFIECVKKPAARLAFELLFWTGMRSGELLALTFLDVDFERSRISINKTAAQVKGETVIQAFCDELTESQLVHAAVQSLLDSALITDRSFFRWYFQA